jgi:hypothetical protein
MLVKYSYQLLKVNKPYINIGSCLFGCDHAIIFPNHGALAPFLVPPESPWQGNVYFSHFSFFRPT